MNFQFKGFQISLMVHAVIFLSIIGMSKSIINVSKAIVIDFNVENPVSSGESQPVQSPKKEAAAAKPAVKEQKFEPVRTEQKVEPKAVVAAPLPATQTAADVPAPPSQSKPKEGQTTAGQGKTTESQGSIVNAKAEGNASSIGGNSETKLKTKYLKKHFAYIRDIIMKNISYPHMARKMGWSGKVLVSFVVYETGHAEDIKVVESSGFAALDRNAVETIKKACPFPKPPVKAELIIPVVYRLE